MALYYNKCGDNLINDKYKKILIVLLIGCMLFTGTSCTNDKNPIYIGFVGTLTGKDSDLSVSGRRGVEIAVDEINQLSGIMGRKVELVIKDDQNNAEVARQVVQEFVDKDVEVVIGHFTSGMLLAAYEAIESNPILYLGPTISADSLSGKDDHFIRLIASTKEQAEVLVEHADKMDHKRFIFIYDEKNIGFNEALMNNMETCVVEHGGEVIHKVGFDNLDKSTLETIQNQVIETQALEAVFMVASAAALAEMTVSLRKVGYDGPIYGPLWAHTDDLIRIGGSYMDGVKVVGAIDPNNSNEAYKRFKEEYTRRFGSEPTFASVYAYEAMMVLKEAMMEAQSTEYQAIKDGILRLRTYQGLQGDFEINEYGDNLRLYILDSIENGTYRRVE